MMLKDFVATLKDRDLVVAVIEKDVIMANHTRWVGSFPVDRIAKYFSGYDTAEVDKWWITEDDENDVPYVKVLIK